MKTKIFIQSHGHPEIIAADIMESATYSDLCEVLATVGVEINADTYIFIDEENHQVSDTCHDPIPNLNHGARVHVTRCKRIKTKVHYLDKTEEFRLPPGVRVRSVKAKAVRKFFLSPQDAAEHVLQICDSMERPASDTPLHELIESCCTICFDLVPDKRIEG